jgi:hypothetical protein
MPGEVEAELVVGHSLVVLGAAAVLWHLLVGANPFSKVGRGSVSP